jgi:hypothetical protein
VVYSTADRNGFFAIPVGIIRRRVQLPPPVAGQPGPFSLGAPGVVEAALAAAGFRDVAVETVSSPVRLASSADCVAFERESFGALHQMLSGLSESDREDAWTEIGGPCPVRRAGWVRRPVRDARRVRRTVMP